MSNAHAVYGMLLHIMICPSKTMPLALELKPSHKQQGGTNWHMSKASVFLFVSQVRRILDVLRGRPYEQCVKMMELMPYRACEPILKTLKSVSTC